MSTPQTETKSSVPSAVPNAHCRPYFEIKTFYSATPFIQERKVAPAKMRAIPAQETKVTPAAVNPAVVLPLSYKTLRSVYGYSLYPLPTKRRVNVAIIIAYLHRSIDGSTTLTKSAMPSDLRAFCAYNGLTPPTFLAPITLGPKVAPISFPTGGPFFVEAAPVGCGFDPYDNGTTPGWPLEGSLDVQSVYGSTNNDGTATGPNIILVHGRSSSFTDLNVAITQAIALGADVISMSWGSPEFLGETYYDRYFSMGGASKISFVASTGDDSFGSYPAFSPHVVAIGGTSLSVSGDGSRVSEKAWGSADHSGNGGGGVSGDNSGPVNSTLPVQEKVPPYQVGLGYKGRAIPDISAFASSNPGVTIVLNQFVPRGGPVTIKPLYYAVGGTSLSAPCMAGLLATANQIRLNNGKLVLTSAQILTALYKAYANTTPSSYCQGYLYNITLGMTYLYTETISIVGTGRNQRKVSTWSYKPDNSAAPVPSSKGYDCATGIGVPAPGLINYLASL